MNQYHLDTTKTKLAVPTTAQIDSCNQWAATALDKLSQQFKSRHRI